MFSGAQKLVTEGNRVSLKRNKGISMCEISKILKPFWLQLRIGIL